jgi:hypothetical protein
MVGARSEFLIFLDDKIQGSQPGVRVPLGVQKQFAGGTPKYKSK